MKENFEEAVEQTFEFEGIKSQDKAGGATLYGIASKYWPKEYTIISGMSKANAIEYAKQFYQKNFWDYIGADSLPYPLDCVAFDCAVNPGENWAKSTLRITQDWKKMLDLRKAYYIMQAKRQPDKEKYIKGWTNRCNTLIKKYTSEVA